MKKILLLICLLFLPTISLAETLTTNSVNIPFQPEKNNYRVTMLIPNSTQVEKVSADGDWYQIKYNGQTGWINKIYTAEGLTEKTKENQEAAANSSNTIGAANSSNTRASATASKSTMIRIVNAALKYGQEFNIDPILILAIIRVESNYRPEAVSSANCHGLMQISYKYAPDFGIDRDKLHDIEYNIKHGTKLLATYFIPGMNGNVYDAIRAYNCGLAGARNGNGYKYADSVMYSYNNYKTNGFPYSTAV